MKTTLLPMAFAAGLLGGGMLHAETPADFLGQYSSAARAAQPTFTPDASRGKDFFDVTHGGDWSCSSCHTKNPAADGRHASTGKRIAPLAPAANAERFTSARSVEKWFRRNCRDVLDRECTAAEKADVLSYLVGIRQ
jgi:cytochrome c peroxidase